MGGNEGGAKEAKEANEARKAKKAKGAKEKVRKWEGKVEEGDEMYEGSEGALEEAVGFQLAG